MPFDASIIKTIDVENSLFIKKDGKGQSFVRFLFLKFCQQFGS